MSITIRTRRARYDNIAKGSATGPERTIAGDTVSVNELFGGGYQTSTSTGDVWHSNNPAGTSTTEGNLPDNLAAGVVPTDENPGSSNAPGFATNP